MSKPDPEIIERLFAAIELRGRLPCYRRGRMYYDFDAGRVRIAEARETA